MEFLKKILVDKAQEVAELNRRYGIRYFKDQIENNLQLRPSFLSAISGKDSVSLIAEIKKGSPSKGVLIDDFNPLKIANKYVAAGADALSVLTDEKYFFGHCDYLKEIADNTQLPILRKDFIIDPIQIYQAKQLGASAVLLIVAALDMEKLRELLAIVRELEMDALVEVHDEHDLGIALHTSAELIGINNRDLRSFKVDLEVTRRLLPLIPESKTVVSESGIMSKNDIPAGVDAVLIGEGLITGDFFDFLQKK